MGVLLQEHASVPLHESVPTEAVLLTQASCPLHELAPTEPLLPLHAASPLQDFEPTAPEFELHALSPPLQDPGAIGPRLAKHAATSSHESGAMGAMLEKQAESPLQEPKATVPVLPVQASGSVHRGAYDPALTIPAGMGMTKIPHRTVASSHIRIFCLTLPRWV